MMMRRKTLKGLTLFTFISLFTLNIASFGFAKDHIICSDPIDDLKIFDQEVLEEIEADLDGDLDEFKELIRDDLWPQGEPSAIPDFIDITKVWLDIGSSTTKFMINVQDTQTDPEDEEIFILIWSDCGDADGCVFQIVGIIGNFEVSGYSEDINIYYGEGCGDENCTGEIEGSNGEFAMEFPTDWLGDEEDCDVFVMLITPLDSDQTTLAIDVAPNSVVGDPAWSIWDLLLIIIFLIAFIALVFIGRKGGRG